MSSLLFSSSKVALSRAGGSFCKASSSSSSSYSSPSSSRTTTTTKSVRFDFRSPRRRRTTFTNKTTTTTYATTSQNDGNTKNNNDENLMSARELKRKLEELVSCFWVIPILGGLFLSERVWKRERKRGKSRTNERRWLNDAFKNTIFRIWICIDAKRTPTNETFVLSFLFFSFSLSLFLSLLACG